MLEGEGGVGHDGPSEIPGTESPVELLISHPTLSFSVMSMFPIKSVYFSRSVEEKEGREL
jgi:hypothetical protein